MEETPAKTAIPETGSIFKTNNPFVIDLLNEDCSTSGQTRIIAALPSRLETELQRYYGFEKYVAIKEKFGNDSFRYVKVGKPSSHITSSYELFLYPVQILHSFKRDNLELSPSSQTKGELFLFSSVQPLPRSLKNFPVPDDITEKIKHEINDKKLVTVGYNIGKPQVLPLDLPTSPVRTGLFFYPVQLYQRSQNQ